ncbi:hypothetical protein A1Q1_05561 [Trichosporon asahii var. asahii CBS 2479]|uniref:Uncharacterized protein n=1 Tax=Trichosporon asahii var. asahii (strain ATCC 90039 / CBS 2479 / JCM 2466 / KCTC 7840 / NBRC 103889/ NCYC 2677 / UAMH 7654) TaxID=1186058 RepID=J4U6X4_TRIAS|nr:hypothetical protein A1Q1_05561 [Trichosporon asahii var. asahii CBS 2479]EJT45975.1 hypothetical protein A1Q1_05561 [Trichosporon asahii var. asahii CBS 2479]
MNINQVSLENLYSGNGKLSYPYRIGKRFSFARQSHERTDGVASPARISPKRTHSNPLANVHSKEFLLRPMSTASIKLDGAVIYHALALLDNAVEGIHAADPKGICRTDPPPLIKQFGSCMPLKIRPEAKDKRIMRDLVRDSKGVWVQDSATGMTYAEFLKRIGKAPDYTCLTRTQTNGLPMVTTKARKLQTAKLLAETREL